MTGPAWLLAGIPFAWLLPNHYPPWDSAWQEGTAVAALLAAALLCRGRAAVPRSWLWAAGVALASIAGQVLSGRILFAGDALMAALYVGLFVLALAAGDAAARSGRDGREHSWQLGRPGSWRHDAAAPFALGLFASAVLCVGIALVQWSNVDLGREWIFGLPLSGRPFSNLGQPNHFDTAAFLGLTSLALLLEAGHVGRSGFWLGAAFLLAGMVMSGSRTAWVQLGIFALASFRSGGPTGLKARAGRAAGVLALYAALSLAWGLQSSNTRSAADVMTIGTRPAAWRDALAAIAREPLWGYGWQQVNDAQQRVALDRPSYLEHITHAHNIALDLLLWAGIPLGGLIVLLALFALARQLGRLSGPAPVWLFAGALGVLAHGLLEYPLEYAYFLLPFGICLGMSHALSPSSPHAPRLPRWTVPTAALALAAVSLLVARDYLVAEEDFLLMRLETSRIGTQHVRAEPPDLLVLDQLKALLSVVRSESRAGMSPAELEQLDKLNRRYGMPGIQYRLALALALNGRPQEAATTLQVLCHVHGPSRCDRVREAWRQQQQVDTALGAVPLP